MSLVAAQTLYDWLLFLHVLAAMVWLGGGVVLAVIAARVLRDREPGAVARFTGSLRTVGPLVLAPATIAVLGLGIGLVFDTDAWDFGQLWVQLGLGLFVGAFLVGAVYQSRTALAAERAATRGDDAEARRQLGRWAWGYRLIVLLLIVAAWDMTTKPGLSERKRVADTAPPCCSEAKRANAFVRGRGRAIDQGRTVPVALDIFSTGTFAPGRCKDCLGLDRIPLSSEIALSRSALRPRYTTIRRSSCR